jgi:threonine/homoserine/homoserine lactone efflux protein
VSVAFLMTCLVVVATPGTGALYTIGTGLTQGWRTSTVAAFACTLGTVPHLLAAITGLAALLQASGVAFAIIKYAGVAYLLYLAWTTWRDTGTLTVETGDRSTSTWRVIGSGITLNLLNPKLTLFFFAFLPQFVATDAPGAVVEMLWLSSVFMAMTFVIFGIYGIAAAAIRDRVLRRPTVLRMLRTLFAATFAALAARLAVQTR